MLKSAQMYPITSYATEVLQRYRLVTYTPSTDRLAYAEAGSSVFGVTLSNGDENVSSIPSAPDTSLYRASATPIFAWNQTQLVDLAGTVSAGDPIFPTTDGKGVTASYEAIRRGEATAPGAPTEGDIYVLDADGWSAAHGNGIAIRGASAWTYVDVDATTNVGIVVYVTAEDKYIQWNGTAWVDAYETELVAYDSGVSGQAIPVGVNVDHKVPGFELDTVIVHSCAGGDTVEVVTHPAITTSKYLFGQVVAGVAGAVTKSVISGNSATLTLSADPTSTGVIHLFVVKKNDKN